jgi:hypothetical protein
MGINGAWAGLRTVAWYCGIGAGLALLAIGLVQTSGSTSKLKGPTEGLIHKASLLHAPAIGRGPNRLIGSASAIQASSTGKLNVRSPNRKFTHEAGLLHAPEIGRGTNGPIGSVSPISTSQHWSGFSITAQQLGGLIYGAVADYTVPQVQYVHYPNNPSVEQVSAWVGVGGNPNSDQTLIQAGTTGAIDSSGGTAYDA